MRDFESRGTPDSGRADAADLSAIDMRELARQLHVLRVSLDGTLLAERQQADMEDLVIAQVAAEEGHADLVSKHLAAVGKWTITAAIDVDAWLAAAAISAHISPSATTKHEERS